MIADILACVGLTFILKYGAILNVPRKIITKVHPSIQELFNCSLCLGFWSGVGIWCIEQDNIVLPLISACVCWYADAIIGILQYTEIKLEKESKR